MNRLILNTQQTLAELNTVIGQLSPQQYSVILPIFSGSSIGMHARHVIEFYQCILSQTVDNQFINYDIRQRDLLLQTQPQYFSETIESIIETLESIDATRLKHPLSIVSNEDPQPIESTLARELSYNLEHTIHHAALIKIGILSLLPQADLPPTFGIAPSTIRFRQASLSA